MAIDRINPTIPRAMVPPEPHLTTIEAGHVLIASLPKPVGPYGREVGEDGVSETVHGLMAGRTQSLLSVGHQDGGPRHYEKATPGGVVYQVTWSKAP